MSEINLYVNLSSINFERTLGVWFFARNLISALKSHSIYCLIAVHESPESLPDSVTVLFEKSITTSKVKHFGLLGVEILCHHFQIPCTNMPFIVIFHDLHIFDVPWKYKDYAERYCRMENLIKRSSAIVTHFPRTYFDLPKVFSDVPNALFLTISPTMRSHHVEDAFIRSDHFSNKFQLKDEYDVVLYPAQFQEHKNHINLFKSIARLCKQNNMIHLVCCGSIFKESYFNLLGDVIEELDIAHNVSIVGYVSDYELSFLFQRADLVISSSLAEGGAYIAQEALVEGKAFLISDIIPAKMHLQTMGLDCCVLDVFDIDSAALQIQSAINNKDKFIHSHIYSQARLRVQSWTWFDLSLQYIDIINWLSGGCASGKMPSVSSIPLGLSLSTSNCE